MFSNGVNGLWILGSRPRMTAERLYAFSAKLI
jgi:hypothetical protein